DVVQALTGIGDVVLGQLRQAAVEQEGVQRLMQLPGQPAQLAKQLRYPDVGQLDKQTLGLLGLARLQTASEFLRELGVPFPRADILLHDSQLPACTRSKIFSIFSFSVLAVKGLTM